MERLVTFFTLHPARFFLFAAILWMALMGVLNAKFAIQWSDIIIEANGMAFDLLVFGILLSLYEVFRENRDRIGQLADEIDDFRKWDEKEAMYRIVGVVKRLNRAGISKIDLNRCFLQDANLQGAILWKADLSFANLQNADLTGAKLQSARMYKADLRGAKLEYANFIDAVIWETDFLGATVGKDWFDKLEKWGNTAVYEIKEKYRIDENGVIQLK